MPPSRSSTKSSSTSSKNERFYKGLDRKLNPDKQETRFIKILPRSETDAEIRCQLVTDSVHDTAFAALSYVWNVQKDGNRPKTIYIDDKKFSVTVNLYQAIIKLRDYEHSGVSTTSELLWWIDAISINQDDDTERSQQVAFMRKIYESAREVIIWLGEPQSAVSMSNAGSDESDSNPPEGALITTWASNIEALPDIIHQTVMESENAMSWTQWIRSGIKTDYLHHAVCLLQLLANDTHLSEIPLLNDTNVMQVLDQIMNSPWWERMWVIQEISVARKAYAIYGSTIIPWILFAEASRLYSFHRNSACCANHANSMWEVDLDILDRFSRHVSDIEGPRRAWQAGEKISLWSLLWQFRSRKAGDKRDKVYAVLGLVTDWGDCEPILPDYKATQTIGDVYQTVALKTITIDRSLSILTGDPEQSMLVSQTLPSWVPDWFYTTASCETDRLRLLHGCHSCGNLPLDIQLHEGTKLSSKAIYVGLVDQVFESMPELPSKSLLSVIRRWSSGLLSSPTHPNPYHYELSEAFWRTICCNQMSKGAGAKEYIPLTDQDNIFRSWWEWAHRKYGIRHSDQHAYLVSSSNVSELARFMDQAIRAATANRRFFITESGYIGLGPASLEKGDHLYILHGGKTPFALRPSASSSEPCKKGVPCKRFNGTTFTTDRNHMRPEGKQHRLIGDCYIQGMMKGEVIHWPSSWVTLV